MTGKQKDRLVVEKRKQTLDTVAEEGFALYLAQYLVSC